MKQIHRNLAASFLVDFYFSLGVGASPAYMFVHHVCAWCLRKPEEGLHPLDQELQMVVSHHAGAENQAQVLLTAEPSLLLSMQLLKWATDNLEIK